MAEQTRSENVRERLVLGGLVLLGGAHVLYHAGYVVDDAYITFRYAHNIAGGVGAVFNPGSYAKGYSNTLFMGLCVLPELLGFSPVAFVKGLGLLAYAVLVAALYRETRATHGPIAAAFGAPAMAVASACLALWYTAGLETGLYTTLVFLAVRTRLHEQETGARPYSAALFAAVALTRPEGIIFFAAMVLHELIAHRRLGRPTLRDFAWYAVPSASYGAELLISKAYYGDYLPSTFYAKVAQTHSLLGGVGKLVSKFLGQLLPGSYFGMGLAAYGGTIALVVFAVICLGSRGWRRNLAYLLAIVAQTAFIARVGGDWMAGYRFVAPVLPFVFLLATGAVMRVAELTGRHRRGAAALGLALCMCAYVPLNLRLTTKLERSPSVDAASHLAAGRDFARLVPTGAAMSSFDVGGEGYAAMGLYVIDVAGLTDELVAKGVSLRKYGALLRPELVSRHPNRHGDAFFNAVRRSGDYAALRNRGGLVERSAIMIDAAPTWAHAATQAPTPDRSGVVATELPRFARPGADVRGTLYWRGTEATREELLSRRVRVQGKGSATAAAEGSPSAWTGLGSIEAWDTTKLAIDRFSFRAPDRLGSYGVAVALERGHEQLIAEIEVVDARRLAQVRDQLVTRAQRAVGTRQTDLALSLLENALALGADERARSAYTRISVKLAEASLAKARAADSTQGALEELEAARRTLHRAYFDCGRADGQLRALIDEVGRERRRRIVAALGRNETDG